MRDAINEGDYAAVASFANDLRLAAVAISDHPMR